jgi:hypothetical protein
MMMNERAGFAHDDRVNQIDRNTLQAARRRNAHGVIFSDSYRVNPVGELLRIGTWNSRIIF